jgi:hypothetical protein
MVASSASKQRQLPYRGSGGDLLVFAPRFIMDRMKGFEKDMRICLTPVMATHRKGQTHAYFPGLAACCGAIEYLGALSIGNPVPIKKGLSRGHIQEFARRYMAQPDYDNEAMRVLWDLFRNGTAHHGITSGVWIDQHVGRADRRLIWAIDERTMQPAVSVREKIGTLIRDPPWNCAYTHVATVHLGQLALDIRAAADCLAADIKAGGKPLERFRTAMEVLYPR